MDELIQATGLTEKKVTALIASAQEMIHGGTDEEDAGEAVSGEVQEA